MTVMDNILYTSIQKIKEDVKVIDNKANINHNHTLSQITDYKAYDDSEIKNQLASKADNSHNHSLSQITDFTASKITYAKKLSCKKATNLYGKGYVPYGLSIVYSQWTTTNTNQVSFIIYGNSQITVDYPIVQITDMNDNELGSISIENYVKSNGHAGNGIYKLETNNIDLNTIQIPSDYQDKTVKLKIIQYDTTHSFTSVDVIEDKGTITKQPSDDSVLTFSVFRDMAYPINSVYSTTDKEFMPTSAFGGTWVLLSSDGTQVDTDTVYMWKRLE